MIQYIGLFIATHLLYNTIEYIYHVLGHYKHKYNYIYKLHITHHKDYYPITLLQSDIYKSNHEGFIAYTPPSLLLLIILYNILPIFYFYYIITQLFISASINNYIHTQIHLKITWLDKYDWFKEHRRLHFIHHRKLNKNYSFGYDYTLDKLNDTYLN